MNSSVYQFLHRQRKVDEPADALAVLLLARFLNKKILIVYRDGEWSSDTSDERKANLLLACTGKGKFYSVQVGMFRGFFN
jgi:hypothetical protein